MKKKLTSVLLFLALSAGVVSAQTSKVTGKVIGEDGEPVIGASIIVKGTTVGTVTDFDGNFELEVPANGKQLVISYIGMKSQEVAATSNVNVKLLADTQNLDEVVVTAMGISKEKKALGYAVQDVKADELTKGANTSLSGALQGKVSGVEISPSSGMPGASSKITIRGSRSFTGDNTPLYVIDGMPVASTADVDTGSSVSGTDFASRAVDIDPNDIESINILKGQAASALYGMRATNGVIVITTKSGKGARKGKPQVAFNTSLSFDKVSTMPEYQKVYAQGTNGKYSPYASTSWGPLISELPNDPTYGGNTDNEFTKQYGKHEGMYYVPQRAAAGLDPWAQPQAYDNIKDFFNVGTTWSNSVNVAQAFDKGNYSFSIGNMEVNIKSALASDYWGGFLNVTNEVTPEEAASYFDENVVPLFDANPLKETMIQKYISFWNADGESTECYNDVRRLKSLGEDIYGLQNPGKFPLRCPYGNDDTTTNPNIQAAYGDGQYVFTENVWWAGGTR